MKHLKWRLKFCSDVLFFHPFLGTWDTRKLVWYVSCFHGHASLLHMIGHMCLISVGSVLPGQRGPSVYMCSWLSSLTSPPARISDPAARTIWNVLHDHLLLMWCQVYSRLVQVSFCFSLSHTETHAADNLHLALFNKPHLHL